MSQQLAATLSSFIAIIDGDSSVTSHISAPPAETEKDHCPRCDEEVSEFGICRARPSGRNLYCKACIRKTVAASRRTRREYRARLKELHIQEMDTSAESVGPRWLKRRYDDNNVLLPDELRLRSNRPDERVFGAIYHGARTQKQITRMTGLSPDAIGDALAVLLLSQPKQIETRVLSDGSRDVVRIYYLADPASPARKPNATAPLSSSTINDNILQPIMKGRAA